MFDFQDAEPPKSFKVVADQVVLDLELFFQPADAAVAATKQTEQLQAVGFGNGLERFGY